MRGVIVTSLVMLFSMNLNAQTRIDLGVRGGIGISNQYWKYTQPEFEWVSGSKENQKGYELYLTSEIHFGKYFSLIPEIGLIEKGFYSNIINRDIASAGGSFIRNTVETQNLTFNVLTRIGIPTRLKVKPFVTIGAKLDHLINVKDWLFKVNGELNDDYHDFIFSDYKSVITSGLLGFGIEWNDLISIEYQINTPFESSTKNNPIQVRDKYQGITIGGKLIRINKESGMSK